MNCARDHFPHTFWSSHDLVHWNYHTSTQRIFFRQNLVVLHTKPSMFGKFLVDE